MATEVNQNCFAWPHEESSVQDSSQGTPQVFDHGSISFGRFDLESLAWEKWSVFTNDRRTEEFVKFNGLVAKKKAYFEEYFKRIRELKALQQQNQQTELNLEYSGDGSDSSQTGEDEPAAKHASPTGSGTLVEDFLEQIAAETTPEHELGCYKDHNESLSNGISSSARSSSLGGLQIIGEETGENASGDNCSHRMDMLQQNAKCSKDDLAMPDVTTENPKRTIEECSPISQASKIIPKTIKMTSSYITGRSFANKGPDSSKPIVIHQVAKSRTVQPLRMPKAATSTMAGNTGRSKIMAKESPGVTAVRRPSSAASQRPSTRERRPVTRDVSQKPTEMASPCRPSTAERRLATRERAANQTNVATPRRPSTADRRPITKESTPKRANIATQHRPSTADRRPITKESAPKHANIATRHRPSTADRRPITKESAPKHANIATPRRPSTAERRPATREMAPKHFGVANPCWPSTAERHHVTRGTAQKHADLVTLRRPSTAERRPITRETAPKHANAGPSRRPSTAERRPVARDSLLKHANVSSSCWPLTPERRLSRDSPPKPADVAIMPCRPSTGQRRAITKETTLKLDPKTPIRLRAVPGDSNGAMATAVHSNCIAVTPQKAITPNLVKSGKPEIKSYAKERLELQVGGKQKSSSVNLPPRKILTSSHRANRVIEDIRKPNKQVIQETVGSRVFASKSVTPSQTGSVKRVPNPPPPPPPPPHVPSRTVSKPSPNKPSGGGRKPKASTPHWH